MVNGVAQDSQCDICSLTKLQKKGIQISLPDFQRGYVWGETQWGQLWDDVSNLCARLMNKDIDSTDLLPQHFMGVITLRRTADGNYDILDGQQRLTTIAMLLDCLEAMGAGRVERIHFTARVEASKATGKDIDDFVNLDPKKGGKDGPTIYEQCCTYFLRRVTESTISPQTAHDVMMNRLFLLVQMVEEDPHDVFENLNATGVALDYGDFLLNVLLERADKERKTGKTTLDDEKIKNRWLCICKSIADIYAAEADEVEGNAESDDSEGMAAVNDGDTKDSDLEDAFCSPIKLKKFLNALHRLTLPFTGAIPETVDAFEACIQRLDYYFGKQDSETVNGVLSALECWADIYRRVVNPQRTDCDKYGFDIYYASIICTPAYIPMLMRVLYRCEEKKITPEQAKALFGAVARFELFAEVYHNERDGSVIAGGRRLLPWLDEIVDRLLSPDISVSAILQLLVAEWDNYTETLLNDLKGEELEKTMLSGVYYSSRYSRLMLSIDYVKSCKGEVPNTFFGPIQVEHMVAQVPDGYCHEDYGFDSSSVNSLYNLILLEQSANSSIKNLPPEIKMLRLLAFKDDEHHVSDLFSQYYNRSASYYSLLATAPKDFKTLQSKRIQRLLAHVACFLLIDPPQHEVRMPQKKLPLLCMERSATGQIVSCAPAPKQNLAGESTDEGPTDARPWLVLDEEKSLNERINLKLIPERTTKSADTVVLLRRNSKPEWCGKEGMVLQMARGLIRGCGAGELHSWMENRINDEKKDEVKEKNDKVWRQMFGIDENDMPYSRGNKANKPSKLAESGELELFYYRSGFNVSDIVRAFKTLYSQIAENNYDCGACLDFTLAYEPAEPSFVFVNNKLLHTNIGYLGQRDLYAAYVAERMTEIAAPIATKSDNGKRICTCDSYFGSETVSFGELLRNYGERLHIPMYQRRYVWGTPQWKDLIQRLARNRHLGTIILYRRADDGVVSVVDGQQRLSTLAMAAAARDAANMPVNLMNRAACVRKEHLAKSFFEKQALDCKRLMDCTFQVLWIENAPERYQYEVFASVNGKGKKLTNEERAKNLLMKRFPNDNKEKIKNFTDCAGFLKAFLEVRKKEHVSEEEFYSLLKCEIKGCLSKGGEEWNELVKYYSLFQQILENGKGWLKAYRMLGVSTGDALLLDLLSREQEKEVIAQDECRRLMTVYFLLYAMQGTANDRKSINSRLPRLVGTIKGEQHLRLACGDNILIRQLATRHKEDAKDISETVWRSHLCKQRFTSMGKAAVFLLLSLENWMEKGGWKDGKAFDEINQNTILEIEHICPVSDANWPSNVESEKPRLSALENLCLLEKTINISVSDKMLMGKDGDGKLKTNKKSKTTYWDSSRKMPKMFYKGNPSEINYELVERKGEMGVFSAEKAKRREVMLHDSVINHLTEALMEILPEKTDQ